MLPSSLMGIDSGVSRALDGGRVVDCVPWPFLLARPRGT